MRFAIKKRQQQLRRAAHNGCATTISVANTLGHQRQNNLDAVLPTKAAAWQFRPLGNNFRTRHARLPHSSIQLFLILGLASEPCSKRFCVQILNLHRWAGLACSRGMRLPRAKCWWPAPLLQQNCPTTCPSAMSLRAISQIRIPMICDASPTSPSTLSSEVGV